MQQCARIQAMQTQAQAQATPRAGKAAVTMSGGVVALPNQPAVILQVAMQDRAFLLDLPALGVAADACLTELFHDPSVLKVGMGFTNDLSNLKASYPRMQCYASKLRGAIDLQELFAKVHTCFPHQVSLVNACLVAYGHPITKTKQMSNWALRPLQGAFYGHALVWSQVWGIFALNLQNKSVFS